MSAHVPWAGWWPYAGRCPCGASVTAESFRDALSWREHQVTSLCQPCQDRLYFCASVSDACVRFPLRRGVLAAPLQRECGLELGVLPFLFVAPEARVAWEPRDLLRAGLGLAPLDPFAELAPMHPALDDHQVRLTECSTVLDTRVRDAFDADLVVVLDDCASCALARLPVDICAPRIVLTDDLPWESLYGAPLLSLLESWVGGVADSSVLRVCALLAIALEPLGAGAFFPFGLVLSSYRERFPELSWEAPDALC